MRRYYGKQINTVSPAKHTSYLPAVIDNPTALRLLALHHPRRILCANDGGGDVDVHAREVVLNVEIFNRDCLSRDAGVLEGRVSEGIGESG